MRLRIETASKRRLTIGAAVDLKLNYDLAGPLESILDHVFDLDPTGDLLESFEKVAGEIAAGNWEGVAEKLGQRGVDALDEFFRGEKWASWTSESDEFKQLSAFAKRLVDSYEGFDERLANRVRALWADVIDVTRLGAGTKVREILEKVSKLDAQNLDLEQYLPEDAGAIVDTLETLTGETIEDLLVDAALRKKITDAATAAKRILELADNTPAELLNRFEELKKRSGITSAVTFLKDHASSPKTLKKKLEDELRPRVRRLVENLAGKAIEAIDPGALAAIQKWAQRVRAFLVDAHEEVDELESKLREAVRKLRGEVGFSISLEIERVTERSALLDITFDASDRKARKAVLNGLAEGKPAAILEKMPYTKEKDDKELRAPDGWTIHEALFVTSRSRSRSRKWVFGALLGSTWNRRLEESRIRVTNTARHATLTAGYATGKSASRSSREFEASAHWAAEATGPVGPLSDPYASFTESTTLKFSLRDTRTNAHELAAMDTLLSDLCFAPQGANAATDVVRTKYAQEQAVLGVEFSSEEELPKDLDVSLDIVLRLPHEAAALYLDVSDPSDWNDDYRRAAIHCFDNPLDQRRFPGIKGARMGNVWAQVAANPVFGDHWHEEVLEFARKVNGRRFPVEIGDRVFSTVVNHRVSTRPTWDIKASFVGLREMILRRGYGQRRLAKLETSYEKLKSAQGGLIKHGDLSSAGRGISRSFGLASIRKNPIEPSFLVWLLLARCASAETVLKAVRGVAVLRWRYEENEDFLLRHWELARGLPEPRMQQLFPPLP